jgi:hypothetical protein
MDWSDGTMKRIGLRFFAAMVVGCTATSAFAQAGLQYPNSVQPVAYESADYYADGSGKAAPSDQPPPIPAESAPAQNGAAGSNVSSASANAGTGVQDDGGFFHRFFKTYVDDINPPPPGPEAPRRALPAPFDSPPFPGSDYQGYPLVGVPENAGDYALMKALSGTCTGDWLKEERIKIYGWANASANVASAKNSNAPESYWIDANQLELDQLCVRVERVVDSVQQDHVDWGFRSTILYGTDYRYMTAGGWFSYQLLQHNQLYGVDPTEQYFEVYIPGCAEGLIIRTGRWIACPDIETQFAPDNYMGSHSILFTFDTYTQTGIMATVMMDKQWTLQACIFAGTDMAPWYPGATPTGMFGARWVSCDNNDSIYTVLNAINNAKFRYFFEDGQLEGHDNFNYLVSTWQHKFDPGLLTKFEGYFMWQRDAVVGGTPSFGPVMPFGGGGGFGASLPGLSLTYGVVNYTELELSKKDFFSIRNEWWNDERGERSGFAGVYTSNAIGITHNFTQDLQIRPEIGYYRNWDRPAFNNGTQKGDLIIGTDMTLRF